MAGSVRQWLAIGASGAMLGMTLAFGSVGVSADTGANSAIVPTQCSLASPCAWRDEFTAGTLDTTTGDVSADDTSNNSGTDTTPTDAPAG